MKSFINAHSHTHRHAHAHACTHTHAHAHTRTIMVETGGHVEAVILPLFLNQLHGLPCLFPVIQHVLVGLSCVLHSGRVGYRVVSCLRCVCVCVWCVCVCVCVCVWCVCVCLCVCVCVCVVCMYVRTYVHTYIVCTCIRRHTYTESTYTVRKCIHTFIVHVWV